MKLFNECVIHTSSQILGHSVTILLTSFDLGILFSISVGKENVNHEILSTHYFQAACVLKKYSSLYCFRYKFATCQIIRSEYKRSCWKVRVTAQKIRVTDFWLKEQENF